MRFVLASASPARLRLLTAAGVTPEVIVSDVDEEALTASRRWAPVELVSALALAKAEAVAQALNTLESMLVLGCDSMLELDGEVLGKPTDATEATSRWRQMRGRAGVLHTGHALIRLDAATRTRITRTCSTTVRFAEISDAEIDFYVASVEPLHVAGAFTIDGLGGWFVESIEGDHHNVVGLSLPALRQMLGELGLTVADLPTSAVETGRATQRQIPPRGRSAMAP